MNRKKELIWSFITVIIAATSIWAVISRANDFTMEDFFDYVASAHPFWLTVAVLLMLSFIVCEGLALLTIVKGFGYPDKFRHGIFYSASDIYFSAITPSATGGQPVCAYFMHENGIPTAVVTLALILNLILYTVSIMVVGVIALLVRSSVFVHFNWFSKLLIIIGYLILSLLVTCFVLMIKKETVLFKIVRIIMQFLYRIRLLKRMDYWEKKLHRIADDYKQCVQKLGGQRKMIAKAFCLNFAQRVAQICIPMAVVLGTGSTLDKAISVWVTQTFVTIGSGCVPIPGAQGVADYLFLDGLGDLVGYDVAVHLDLLCRSISFYGCALLSIVIVAIGLFGKKLIDRLRRK